MRRGLRSTISIFDFICTGKFGCVELGQNYQEIKSIFPKPDGVFKTDQHSYIWNYGAFEFHFIDGVLTLLWCDNLDFMFSPAKKQFRLDRWIIGKYKDGFTLSLFIEELHQEKITFKMLGTYYLSAPEDSLPDNVILKIDNTTTVIYFENIEEDITSFYDYKLIAIGSTSNDHSYKTYPL